MKGRLDAIREELITKLRAHEFLIECREGTVSREAMYTFLTQQAIYGRHFTRLLCALMSNLQDNTQVYALADNLFEELGLDDEGVLPHSVLFQNMLRSFGIEDPPNDSALPGTLNLIDTMYAQCRDSDVGRGLGALCLGAEALVPAMYGDILRGLKALGHTDTDCTFFRLHIECDDGHAETMQEILEGLVQNDASRAEGITTAGRLAVEARLAFFDSIRAATTKQLAETG